MIEPSTATFEISLLADRPELAAPLIPDLLAHWRPIAPEETAETRATRFRQHLNRDVLPIAWVAHAGDEALGTAALRRTDLPGHEHLTPWLGGVFVRPPFRGRGIAAALCAVVEAKARALGWARLYLFTIDQQALYARLGWVFVERVEWRGHDCVLMAKELTGSP